MGEHAAHLRVVDAGPPVVTPSETSPATGSPERWSLTAALGVAGCRELDHGLMAALLSGDPLLIVGSHGAAKTTLVRRIAMAMEMGAGFHAYDASKALFEDVVGFPDPRSLAEGERVRYVPTPLSLAGKRFILLDELSRALPSMQNKWLEVIRSRTLMGEAMPELRFVFAAMNPPSYLGAHPCDEALAGRFAIILEMPAAGNLSPEDLRAVIEHVGEDDAPLLACGRTTGEPLVPLCRRIEAGRLELDRVRGDRVLAGRLTDYVAEVFSRLARRGSELDGRRLAMVRRNLDLYLAVEGVIGGASAVAERGALVLRCLRQSLPGLATGAPIEEALVLEAHRYAFERLRGFEVPPVVDLSGDPVAFTARFLAQPEEYDDDARAEVVTSLLERLEAAPRPRDAARAAFAICQLGQAVMEGQVRLEREPTSKLLAALLRATEPSRPSDPEVLGLLDHVRPFGGAAADRAGDVDLAFRVAARIATREARGGGPSRVRRPDVVSAFREALEELRALGTPLEEARS